MKNNMKTHNHGGQVSTSRYVDIKSNRTLHNHIASDVAQQIICYNIDLTGVCSPTPVYIQATSEIPHAVFKTNVKTHSHTYTYAFNCVPTFCYDSNCVSYTDVPSCQTGMKNITGW